MTRLVPETMGRNNFNFLRMAMALLVIWSHSFALYYGSEDSEPVSLLFNGHFNAGNIGVRVFFMISGFLITASFLNSSSLWSYLRKRIARIYPGFIVTILVCTFIVIPLFSTKVDFSAASIARTLTSALALRDGFPPSDVFARAPHHLPAVNGSLWSISFEFWCYIGVAALGLVGLLGKRAIVLGITLAIMAAKVLLDHLGIVVNGSVLGLIFGWPPFWLNVAPPFLMGVLAYLYRDRLPRSSLIALGLLVALIVSTRLSPLLSGVLLPPAIAYLTFYIGFSGHALPDLARHGDFSYGTYLYAFPIQQMLVEAGLSFPAYVLLAALLSVSAGAASWFLVERRFVRRKQRSTPLTDPAGQAGAAAARSA